MLSLLNLPPHLRNIRGSILLTGIIPGKDEPQNLDPYMDIIVKEIKNLNGLRCFDAFQNEEFDLQVNIVMHILDYPGQNKLFHCAAGEYFVGVSLVSSNDCSYVKGGEWENWGNGSRRRKQELDLEGRGIGRGQEMGGRWGGGGGG